MRNTWAIESGSHPDLFAVEIAYKISLLSVRLHTQQQTMKSRKSHMSGLSNHNLIGVPRCFREAIDHLILFAKTDMTILIEGEAGTGKNWPRVLQMNACDRQGEPFIPVNL